MTLSFFIVLINTNKDIKFEKEKILTSSLEIEIFDNKNNIISDENRYTNKNISISTLPNYVKDAFISIEDKDFYSHSGLNYKRIIKAAINNLKKGKVVEGGSTISQQLIKNTHLSSDKTFSRKIKEMLLTKDLEKNFSKDEILENYLNVIYFGNGAYGIENASKYYFSKSAKNLSLAESCTLASIIKSPGNYSPIKSYDKCLKRRNLVLKEMQKDGKITKEEYDKTINTPIILNIKEGSNKKINTYSDEAINEASKILKIPAKQISLDNYKIFTYFSADKQKMLSESVQKDVLNENDYACISINNKTMGIESYHAESPFEIMQTKRQPGSAIKPILVYAPALNENKISPITPILDEEINISGYKPNNVNKTFSGYVSTREALSKSMNIPAIKVLSYIGIDNAISYAKKCGISFAEADNNYAIALGGMTNGVTIKEIANAYSTFANNGIFKNAGFVKYIVNKNGKVVYVHNPISNHVFREDSNYLMLNMLFESTKKGTSKRLSSLPYQIASKTGTVGNDNNNSDAWNISLTTNDTVGVWIGNLKTNNIDNFVGGRESTDIVKRYFEKIYETNKPEDFAKPTSVCEVEIDTLSLTEKHIVERANEYMPERYISKEIFSRFNLPKEKSTTFMSVSPASISGSVDENGNIKISFDADNFLSYDLYEIKNGSDNLVKSFSNISGKTDFILANKTNKINKFYLVTKIKNHTTGYEILSDKSNIVEIILNKNNSVINNTLPQKSKWYI